MLVWESVNQKSSFKYGLGTNVSLMNMTHFKYLHNKIEVNHVSFHWQRQNEFNKYYFL